MRSKRSIGTFICSLFLIGGGHLCHAQTPLLTFEVISGSAISDSDQVFITGNHQSLGMWDPAAVPMTRTGAIWNKTLSFPAGTHLEFKFTKGTWDSEAVTADGRPPSNYQFEVNRDTTLRFQIPFWLDSVFNASPAISGDFRIHDGFPLEGLASRRVIVWLPPSYAMEMDKRYPVLYMHDGQNVFDPYTSTLGHDWRIDEIADSLIRRGEIEEFICVATYCSPNVRGQEYSDDPDLGEKFQDFMCCQLKPWIDSVYRTDPAPNRTAVMGASMGGLISFILAWEYSDVFGMAACMSPAFKFEQFGQVLYNYVDDVEASEEIKPIDLYIDNGTVGLELMLQVGVDEMLEILDAKGYQYTWYLDKGAPHNEIAWSRRAWRPLVQFFGIR